MKKTIALFGILTLTASPLLAAESDAKSDIKSAVKKLADASGYSWKTTVDAGNAGGGGQGGRLRAGPTEGKTTKDGTTLLSLTRGETTTEAVLKGDKGAVKTQEGWQSLAELTSAGDAAGGNRGNRGSFMARSLQNLKKPATEAEDLLGKVKELKKTDGAYSGDLTEEGAKSLIAFGGRGGPNAPQSKDAKGSVKFWVTDGALTKYEFSVSAKITVGENERDIKRTTSVEIKSVGSTKIEVPDEAKKKLS